MDSFNRQSYRDYETRKIKLFCNLVPCLILSIICWYYLYAVEVNNQCWAKDGIFEPVEPNTPGASDISFYFKLTLYLFAI